MAGSGPSTTTDTHTLNNTHPMIHWQADAEAEGPILWPPDAESQLIRNDPNAGKD